MANIEIKIQTQDGADGKIYSVSSSAKTNNVSKIIGTKTNKNDGQNMKSWAKGFLSLKDGYVGGSDSTLGKQNGYNGYVFGATDDNGAYQLTITLVGENIDRVVIWGDKNANQFPVRAYLDGDANNIIYNDDVEWAIKFDEPKNSHTITFLTWNRVDYNACLTHIAIMLNELTFNNSWIKNVESTSQTTSYPNELFYGVIPNSGSIELLDRNGEIADYIDDGILPNSNIPVEIYANGKKVQDHIINDSSYDINSRVLSTEMTNKLSAWDNLQYAGFPYPNGSKNAFEVLYHCLTSVGYLENEINEMLAEEIVYGTSNIKGTVKTYLQNIEIPYPYLPSDTLRNTIEKFCVLAQLQVYVNSQDQIKFVSARPIEPLDKVDDVLVVEAKKQNAQFSETKILKNKYNAVELNVKKVTDEIDYDVIVASLPDEKKNLENIFLTKTNTDISQAYVPITAVPQLYHYYGAYIINTLYYSDTIKFEIYKKQNMNLENILRLYEDIEDIGISVKCEKHIGKAVADFTFDSSKPSGKYGSVDNIEYSYDSVVGIDLVDLNTQYKYLPDFGVLVQIDELDASQDNLSFFKITDMGNYWNVECSVLVGSKKTYFKGDKLESYSFKVEGEYEEFIPKQLELTFYGDKRTISFEDISASDSNITSAEYVARVDGSELLQQNTVLQEIKEESGEYVESKTKMSDIIKKNINTDYAGGIADGVVSTICSDYNTVGGDKAKDWSQGDLIEPLNCIRVDKDNLGTSASKYKDGSPKLWKVVGRQFDKTGVPLQKLTVQETKFVETFKLPSYTVQFPEFLEVYLNDNRIYSGSSVEMGQNIVIKDVNSEYFSSYNGVTFNFLDVNGETININKPIELFPVTSIKITKNTIIGVNYTGTSEINKKVHIDTSTGEPYGSVFYTDNEDKLHNNSIKLYDTGEEIGEYSVSDSTYTVYFSGGAFWFDLEVADTYVNISKNATSPDFSAVITIEAICDLPAKTVYN